MKWGKGSEHRIVAEWHIARSQKLSRILIDLFGLLGCEMQFDQNETATVD